VLLLPHVKLRFKFEFPILGREINILTELDARQKPLIHCWS
jgi:hypothetical protein